MAKKRMTTNPLLSAPPTDDLFAKTTAEPVAEPEPKPNALKPNQAAAKKGKPVKTAKAKTPAKRRRRKRPSGLVVTPMPRVKGMPTVLVSGYGPRQGSTSVSLPVPDDIYDRLTTEVAGSRGQALIALVRYALDKLDEEKKCLSVAVEMEDME